jgi:hypothetical protein
MPRCTGTVRATGEQCRRNAVAGAVVCLSHGGAAPQVRAKASERLLEAKLRRTLADLGVPEPVGDPLTALQLLAAEVLAWKEICRGEVAKLTDLGYTNQFGDQVRAAVVVYERAMDRAAQVLASIARLNIDERLAGITAAQKLMVIRAMEAGMVAGGLSGPALDAAKVAAGRHLRVLAAAADDRP